MKKQLNKKVLIPLSAAGILAAALGGSSLALASYTVHGKRQTLAEARKWQSEHYDISWYDALETEDYEISSFDGYRLHVQLCRNPGNPDGKKYMILSHGYTDNRLGTLKYMRIYLSLGYHCVIYDLRGHGENKPTFCTYSVREGQDLAELIRDTYLRYGKDIVLGLHGESLGASTTIASLGYQQDVDFAVADCGFSDIENVIRRAITYNKYPSWLTDCASAAAKLRYGWSYSDMRPNDKLSGNKVPILFLHGEKDLFILPENSERMAKATSGYQELHLIPGASHANSVLTAPELYEEYVRAFLQKLNL